MKKILIGVLIGVVLGATGSHLYTRCNPRPTNPEFRHKFVLRQFSRRLHLNEDQKKQLTLILQEKRKKMDALRTESRPKYEVIRKETREEIRKILTPEQQAKFETLDAELNARWHKYRRP